MIHNGRAEAGPYCSVKDYWDLHRVGTAFYAVQRFIAPYPMNPGHQRVDAVHGDESPDAINRVPTVFGYIRFTQVHGDESPDGINAAPTVFFAPVNNS